MARAVARCDERFPTHAVRIGAQAHLERFYGYFGFIKASDVYVEDGIAHIEMLRQPAQAGVPSGALSSNRHETKPGRPDQA